MIGTGYENKQQWDSIQFFKIHILRRLSEKLLKHKTKVIFETFFSELCDTLALTMMSVRSHFPAILAACTCRRAEASLHGREVFAHKW